MTMKPLRIGYVPFSKNLMHPGDRRRFCYYVQRRGLSFEIANPSQSYDVVILTQAADLSQWSRFPRDKGKVIYDLIDSYLAIPGGDLKRLLRGSAKFVSRQSRYPRLNFTKTIQEMCCRADGVICSTAEQKRDILNFCLNVHEILDFHITATKKIKLDYSSGDVFNFVWEGMGGNICTFKVIRDAMKEIRKRHRFTLHLVTDIEYYRWLRNVSKASAKNLVRKVFDFDEVYLYEWNERMFSTICTACDLALIPIPLDSSIYAGKPENKLLLFWRMGIPVVTSATPAYVRAMQGCGLSMTCQTTEDWVRVLERYMEDETVRREAGQRGMAYAGEHYGEDALLKRWDDVFESVLDGHYQS